MKKRESPEFRSLEVGISAYTYIFGGVHLFESYSDFHTIAKPDVFRTFINVF